MAPFSGGAEIYNSDSHYPGPNATCSSGFGVYRYGYPFILTAAHCATPPDYIYAGEPNSYYSYMGQAVHENWGHDVILVAAYSVSGRIYDGPGVANSTGQFEKSVSGWNWAVPGMYVCQSGMISGAVCGIQVSNNFTFSYCAKDSDNDWTCMNDLIAARRVNGARAAQHGDSGGPVFGLDGARVTAIGTISGGRTDDTSWMYFQDFGTAWYDFDISVATNY